MEISAFTDIRGGGTRRECNGGQSTIGDREEAAAYVAELSRDLAVIARRHGLDVLGYLLEMARLEAENVTRHMNG